ncbi:TadE/TadG family type IV pilus assembly protein [Alteriqipengyuania lutimaris]|nr:TadE/TadG family type IV pilus assembly protein [Alteriqipengyuania lutimaris]MBB3032839.1 Flp pilus assembly pilin Flp [Alteriqipengyuania lutimaris]
MILARLRDDRNGATLIEFAIVAPVLCLMVMGAFDVAHSLYLRTVTEGIMQKAGRDSSLETSSAASAQNALDKKVKDQVRILVKDAEIETVRRYYRSFAEAKEAKPEEFNDSDSNGRCNDGEAYEDANGNNMWDADGGNQGQGGAKDAVYYTVIVKYDALFPLWSMIGRSQQRTVTASTILRNQPYNDQGTYAAPVWKNCT